jgi:hypothetical protein
MENMDTRFTPGKQPGNSQVSTPVPGSQFQARMQAEDVSFREFIKTNLKRPQVSPEFIQSIKDKIRVG